MNRQCENCCMRREDLLESGNGSQIICCCYEELEEEICENEKDASEIKVDDNNEALINTKVILTTSVNESTDEIKSPSVIKRKLGTSSKLFATSNREA